MVRVNRVKRLEFLHHSSLTSDVCGAPCEEIWKTTFTSVNAVTPRTWSLSHTAVNNC